MPTRLSMSVILSSFSNASSSPRQGTNSSQKHEMLFSRFQINYNELSARFKKGSVVVREPQLPDTQAVEEDTTVQPVESLETDPAKRKSKKAAGKTKEVVKVVHVDIIKDEFWLSRPSILNG